MLTLHHADGLEPLLDELAALLRVPPEDPFTPEVVVVPAAGMQDAVMAGLGVRNRVVANVDFIFPGTFIGRAVGEVEGDPWGIDRLTWHVLEVISEHPELLPWSLPGRPLANPWSTARRIADLFDRYASQRPQMLTAWHAGSLVDGTLEKGVPVPLSVAQQWQALLWQAVRAHIAQPSPPERLAQWLASENKPEPALPARVFVFGLGSLSAMMLTALRGLAPDVDVHVFLRVPSRTAWQASPHGVGAGQLREAMDVADCVNHPLLMSWGRPALEARALIGGLDHVTMQSANVPLPEAASVLSALQRGIRLDTAPVQIEVDPNDLSFQVHACHGALRQLEVLRDALGHAFVADPSLQAHEVLVLCPDIEQYAPLVESVLGRGALPVPVHVGDRSLTFEEPVHAVVQGVLAVVSGRASLSEVLSLAQLSPVRRAFGWSVEDVERLSQWCSATGTRWGLTPDLRTDWLTRDSAGLGNNANAWGAMSALSTGTWEAMSSRLLAGVAMPAPAPRLALGDVVPYDDMGADEARLAGSLADFLAHLVEVARFVATAHPLAEWTELLHHIVDQFCATERNDSWRLDAVHSDLDDLLEHARTSAESGVCSVPLSRADVEAALSNLLAERPGRLRLRTGAVTVTSTLPMRGVDARVVALLGLDDGAVRVGGQDGDDVLTINPCVGDRNPRLESRQLLLDAVLAAQDRLIITCNGADLTTNKEVPFVVALTELLEVVRTVRGNLDKPAAVHHPRHGFNEQALLSGKLLPGVTFTFDGAAASAAEVRRAALAAAAAGKPDMARQSWLLDPRPVREVTIDDLVAAVMNPARTYLRERLDVVLPRGEESLDDNLSIAVGPLDQAGLGRRLFDAVRDEQELDAWRIPVQHEGTLPPGDLGTLGLDAIIDEVHEIGASMVTWGIAGAPDDHREIAIDSLPGEAEAEAAAATPAGEGEAAPTLGNVKIVGVVSNLFGSTVADFRFAKPRPSYRLGLAVRLAALQYAYPSVDWQATLVRRSAGSEPPIDVLRIAGQHQDRKNRAAALLGCALHLYEWSLRDAVPLFERASEPIHRGSRSAAAGAFTSDIERNEWVRLLWDRWSLDDVLEAPLLPTDPAAVHAASRVERADGREVLLGRGVATAAWVWGTYGKCIEVYDHKAGAFVPASGAALVVEKERDDDE